MKKRILSLLLAMLMVLSLIPSTTFATETVSFNSDGEPRTAESLEYLVPDEDEFIRQEDVLIETGNIISMATSPAAVLIDEQNFTASTALQPFISTSGASSVKRYTVLALDRSGSMVNGSTVPFVMMKIAAIKFCENVLKADGENYVAIVSYGSNATTDCTFTSDFPAAALADKVQGDRTGFYEAIFFLNLRKFRHPKTAIEHSFIGQSQFLITDNFYPVFDIL